VLLPIGSKALLALNVWPFPGQPVSVKVAAEHAFLFPIRLADGTDYLRPEQLAMFMSADVRRKAIVLNRLKRLDKVHVHSLNIPAQNPPMPIFEAVFMKLDEMANSVDLVFPALPSVPAPTIGLPIDQLLSVWLGSTGIIHVMLDTVQFVPYVQASRYPSVG
jgi:hypothetical protein